MRPECAAAAASYRLALPHRPQSGRAGDRLGGGTGSSLEFLDFRSYVPGDDLRHVDWRSYARTDQLHVRLFREEVAPTLEIVADLSRSMAVTPAKEQALRDLVEAAAEWTVRAGGRPRRLAAGGGPFETADEVEAKDADLFQPRVPLRPRSLRLFVGDFLREGDPAPDLRRLAQGAAHLYVIQILDPWELEPDTAGPTTLLDAETDARLDVALDRAVIDRYRTRLARLCESVARATRAAGGSYARVAAAEPPALFRSLLEQGILEPA